MEGFLFGLSRHIPVAIPMSRPRPWVLGDDEVVLNRLACMCELGGSLIQSEASRRAVADLAKHFGRTEVAIASRIENLLNPTHNAYVRMFHGAGGRIPPTPRTAPMKLAAAAPTPAVSVECSGLHAELLAYRSTEAERLGLSAFRVFTDAQLDAVLARRPITATALECIDGFGGVKSQHGEQIVEIVKSHAPRRTAEPRRLLVDPASKVPEAPGAAKRKLPATGLSTDGKPQMKRSDASGGASSSAAPPRSGPKAKPPAGFASPLPTQQRRTDSFAVLGRLGFGPSR